MDGRDYSRPGWYFVTLGADYHKPLFGEIVGSDMRANALGALVERFWDEIPTHYSHIALGARQVMPNHFHGIVRIHTAGGAGLGEVMNLFKGSVTRVARKNGLLEVSRHGGKAPEKVWAPNYWDVICFEPEQLAIREAYVRANPRQWALKRVPAGRIKRSAYKGNIALLNAPLKRLRLRVSRRASQAEIAAVQTDLADFDGIVCSTFFSWRARVS